MNEVNHDPLDDALAALPRSVPPQRDLWPAIQARLDVESRSGAAFSSWPRVRLAAGMAFIAATIASTSAVTYVIARRSMQEEVRVAQQLAQQRASAPIAAATPVSFGADALGEDFVTAREALTAQFDVRVAALPPAERARLEHSLSDLRRAANEISATLAEHPSDPLLQDLLMSAYQSELQLLANVGGLAHVDGAAATRADL